MRTFQRLIAASLCLIASQAIPAAQAQTSTQVESLQPIKIYPLPGALDNAPMLNSNSPEMVNEPGILVSTLPPERGSTAASAFLNYAFEGDFGLFSHHILKDEQPGDRMLYLGLVATNYSGKPVHLNLKEGASFLSQPDAPFKDLPSFVSNPGALMFAGPGDRVASELIAGKSAMMPGTVEVPPCSGDFVNQDTTSPHKEYCPSALIMSHPINTDVAIPPSINGRSTLAYFSSDGPVYLTYLAWFAKKEGDRFVPPTLDDYISLIDAGKLAGSHEEATLDYVPGDPPKGVFKYGRVAGVSQGLTWKGKLWDATRILERPAPGQKVGYPIAAVHVKRYGTGQDQSGTMLRRYMDSPLQSHSNYGVRYELDIPLHNTTGQFQTYSLALNHPANMPASGKSAELQYLFPPNKPVVFRGSVRLRWVDEYNQQQDNLNHLVLRHGQQSAPLAMLTVPPGTKYDLKLSLIYPADATPPQILTIERVE